MVAGRRVKKRKKMRRDERQCKSCCPPVFHVHLSLSHSTTDHHLTASTFTARLLSLPGHVCLSITGLHEAEREGQKWPVDNVWVFFFSLLILNPQHKHSQMLGEEEVDGNHKNPFCL